MQMCWQNGCMLTRYPNEASFRTDFDPYMEADIDANPHMRAKGSSHPAKPDYFRLGDCFLFRNHRNYWLISGRSPQAAATLAQAVPQDGERPVAITSWHEIALPFMQSAGFVVERQMNLNWYRLAALHMPSAPQASFRLAEARDIANLCGLMSEFAQEALQATTTPEQERPLVEKSITAQRLFVLEDADSLIGMGMGIPNGPGLVRLGSIYTPHALRGRGLASWLTAQICQHYLQQGVAVSLHADEALAHTNRMYQKLGFVQHGQHAQTYLAR